MGKLVKFLEPQEVGQLTLLVQVQISFFLMLDPHSLEPMQLDMSNRNQIQNQLQLAVPGQSFVGPKRKISIWVSKVKKFGSVQLTADKLSTSSLILSSFAWPTQGQTAGSVFLPCCPLMNASCSLWNSPRMVCETRFISKIDSKLKSRSTHVIFNSFFDSSPSFTNSARQEWTEGFGSSCNFVGYWKIEKNL